MKKYAAIISISTLILLNGCTSLKEPETSWPFDGDYSGITQYLSDYIQQEMKRSNITGLSVALVDGQKTLWSDGFGYANKEQAVKATSNTVYRAGSVSKIFNAIAVMQLVDQGKLDINQPLVEYLPQFSIKSRFGSTDGITLRTLLSHHSGIPGDFIDGMWSENPASFDELVTRLGSEYVAYPPNYIFSYSNIGITLSGHAVQNVSGIPYEQYMSERVLDVLEMQQSDFSGRLQGHSAASGYIMGKLTPELPLRDIPAGGLNTTVTDLANLVKAVHDNGRFKQRTLLSTTSLKTMLEPQNKDIALDLGFAIGLGWFYERELLGGKHPIAWHTGQTIAHSAKLVCAPSIGLGVVLLSNSPGHKGALDRITKKAMQLLYSTKEKGPKTDGSTVLNKIPISVDADLSGDYSGLLGLIRVTPEGQKYRATALNTEFSLVPESGGWYSPRLALFGFLPLRPEGIRDFQVGRTLLDDHSLLIGYHLEEPFILGEKLTPVPENDSWSNRLGTYRSVNPPEIASFRIQKLELKRQGGHYLMSVTGQGGQVTDTALKPVNDHEAILPGLGRGMAETVSFKTEGRKEYAQYSGLQFELIVP